MSLVSPAACHLDLRTETFDTPKTWLFHQTLESSLKPSRKSSRNTQMSTAYGMGITHVQKKIQRSEDTQQTFRRPKQTTEETRKEMMIC